MLHGSFELIPLGRAEVPDAVLGRPGRVVTGVRRHQQVVAGRMQGPGHPQHVVAVAAPAMGQHGPPVRPRDGHLPRREVTARGRDDDLVRGQPGLLGRQPDLLRQAVGVARPRHGPDHVDDGSGLAAVRVGGRDRSHDDDGPVVELQAHHHAVELGLGAVLLIRQHRERAPGPSPGGCGHRARPEPLRIVGPGLKGIRPDQVREVPACCHVERGDQEDPHDEQDPRPPPALPRPVHVSTVPRPGATR